MHTQTIVAQLIQKCVNPLHAKRRYLLIKSVAGLINGHQASLSGIALHTSGTPALRHRLKSVNRLLGNTAIKEARYQIYKDLAHTWLSGLSRVLIIVDWSDVTLDQKWQCLRASIALKGRSLTLYEEVHPRCHLGNRLIQHRFLDRLASLLPASCQPIIVADSGFRTPWFRYVSQLGWNWIGRIRNRDMVKRPKQEWDYGYQLYKQATHQAKDMGEIEWVRRNPIKGRLIVFKDKPKGRVRKNVFGQKTKAAQSLKQSKREREPWLLVSSEGLAGLSATTLVSLYRQRMQIEQTFRDTKNYGMGLGLSAAKSRSQGRFEILLLLIHLAMFVLYMLGQWVREKQLHRWFQNTKRANEVSVITLARRFLDRGKIPPGISFLKIFESLRSLSAYGWRY